ncbi:MAG: preprotein translocase subunit SecE [Alphaproteobacteria bacterium]|nr:preprotein translocase subunit SecE [Alphaproteobacteria bacterium]
MARNETGAGTRGGKGPKSPPGAARGSGAEGAETGETKKKKRTPPGEFLRQVRQEGAKVTWPSRKETAISTAMVLFVCFLFAIFFLIVDWVISTAVRFILG